MGYWIYEQMGESIAAKRKRAGKTQEQMAQLLKISRASIANIEAGRHRIAMHQLYEIADALESNITDLLPPAPEKNNKSAKLEIKSTERLSARDKSAVREALAAVLSSQK